MAVAGCGESVAPRPSGHDASGTCCPPPTTAESAKVVGLPPASGALGENDRQWWQILMLGGNRVGYASTTVRHVDHEGRQLVQIEGLTVLRVQRFDQMTEQRVLFTDIQAPDGTLVRTRASVEQGREPLTTLGVVQGDSLELELRTLGKTTRRSIPWSAECGGFHAVEQSLLREPMQPGDQRRLKALIPGLIDPVVVELTAVGHEQATLPGGQFRLLRIDNITRLGPEQELHGALWTDPDGEVLKTWTETLDLETYRVPKAAALAEVEPADFDLGYGLSIAVEKPPADPHRAARLRYRVSLDGADPAKVFPQGPSQRVLSIGPHAAEVTVYALRAGLEGNLDAPPQTPSAADLEPSNMIQSNAPEIVELAREAVGDEDDPWGKAVALERFVHGYITEKDYSQAFATAAEVAREREGDCTEHAVLLAALCRAAGIPARVAAGLVYLPRRQAFFFHMWTEAYVDGRFVPLDATIARGGAGAGHLKLVHTSLEGTTAFTALLPVARVIGRLNIEVIDEP